MNSVLISDLISNVSPTSYSGNVCESLRPSPSGCRFGLYLRPSTYISVTVRKDPVLTESPVARVGHGTFTISLTRFELQGIKLPNLNRQLTRIVVLEIP